ncbi:MAG: putative polyphosphate kinase [Actinomycetota bacterium]
MNRNLDRRIETLIRVDQSDHKSQLNQLLNLYFSDEIKRWEMNMFGIWQLVNKSTDGRNLMDIQDRLIVVSRGRN